MGTHTGFMLRHQHVGVIAGRVWMREPSEAESAAALETYAPACRPGWLRAVPVCVEGETSHAKPWRPETPPPPAAEPVLRLVSAGVGRVTNPNHTPDAP